MSALKQASLLLNQLNEWIGRSTAWLTTILMLIIVIDVVFRYLFQQTAAWVIDLEWHVFALIFLFGGGYALKHDKHVRVDLFYTNFSERDRSWVNLLGALLLLIPWCLLTIWFAGQYAILSFSIGEGAPDPNGLPFRYLIKFAVVLGFAFLLLQAISLILESILTLQKTSKDS